MNEDEVWQRLQFSQAAKALEILAGAGIPCLLLKGGAGLLGGWLSPSQRPITDIDILVPPSELKATARVLAGHGWGPPFDPYEPVDARRHSRDMSSPWGFLVDIHWFSFRHARWKGVDDILWKDPLMVFLGKLPVKILRPEAFLVHTVIHGKRVGSPGAKWREDLCSLLQAPTVRLDWNYVLKVADNYKAGHLVASALEEVQARVPGRIPDGWIRRLQQLPVGAKDRLFLALVERFREEPGFFTALIVLMDFTRTRPTRFLEAPAAFVEYLKDRWELPSRSAVPARFVEVMIWGLQLEMRRLVKKVSPRRSPSEDDQKTTADGPA